ncbi:MAG: PAS domain-containing sensor histidine kinase [Candidatus Levybacteria bacterium]|nr:PAS domain-containing sensor histidine kinase [Candidatus Levybacteria bacterium]
MALPVFYDKLYKRIFLASKDAIGIISSEGFYLEQNAAHRKLIGYTDNELHQKTPAIHFGKRAFNKIVKELQKNNQYRGIHEIRAKDGTKIPIDLSAFAVKDERGKILCYVGIKRDISNQKKTEEALQKSRDELEVILQGIADGITVQNETGKLVYANNAAGIAAGFPTGEDMVKTPPDKIMEKFELMDESGNPFPLERLPGRKAMLGETNPEALIRYRNKQTNEEKWVIIKARAMFDDFGKPLMSINILHDVTERKKVEKRKDEFISIASHELKTPITSIKAYVQILQKQLEKQGNSESSRFLLKIDRQIEKLTDLIADLLDVSKIQAGKLTFQKTRFSLDGLLKEVVEDMQRISESHKIVIKSLKACTVAGDKERIEQVLINLLTNAMKYSPKSNEVHVNVAKVDSMVKVSVTDFGIGIGKEDLRRVFERFFRISGSNGETFPGLGVGLYICAEIIKRHQGRIWVESARTKGSTFHFTLPRIHSV